MIFPRASRSWLELKKRLPQAGAGRVAVLTWLARVSFILGNLAEQSQRQQYYEKGRGYAEALLREQPGGVAGRYWLAVNLCGLADVGGKPRGPAVAAPSS